MKKNKEKLIWIIMRLKLILIALLFSVGGLYASVKAQNERVDVKMTGTLDKLFELIEQQTHLRFVYNQEDIKDYHFDCNEKNVRVEDILTHALSDKGLRYEFVKENIVISKKELLSGSQQPEMIKIKGIVKDSKNNPIPGATVLIKGTSVGVSTAMDGTFKLDFPKSDKKIVLVISFVGMKSQEVEYKGQENIDVKLEDEVAEMEEVVVTGYYNRAVESYTGSVKTLKKDELIQTNPTNLLSSISILDPSFKLMDNNEQGSNPNTIPDFEMRGASSLPNLTNEYEGNTNMPTFILDGFEVSAEKVFDLDPQRVESITLLKDAAATAIYGSRAANGVVVITTSLPKSGKIDVSYNLDMTGTFPDLRDYHVLDARQKLALEKAAGYYENDGSCQGAEGSASTYNNKLKLLERGNNTYWLNKPLQNVFAQKHSLILEGGEQKLRFSLSGTYENAPGVMKKSGRTRKGLSVMLQYTVAGKLIFRNTMSYDNVMANNTPYGSFKQYTLINPYYAMYDDKGNYLYRFENFTSGSLGVISNPMFNSQLNVKDYNRYNEWKNDFSADWFVSKSLRLKLNFSISEKDSETVLFKPALHTDFSNYSIYSDDVYRRGSYKQGNGKGFMYDGNFTLSYNKTIGKQYINLNGVFNVQESNASSYGFTVEGFPDDKLDFLAFALQYSETDKHTATDAKSRLMGFLCNANYTYDNRYLLDFSYRTDASSKFGADRRWAPFWSIGLGWNLNNESWLKEKAVFERLKIRGSYGTTGSQSFNPYQAITTYSYWLDQNYRYGVGASMKGLGNNKLKWQQNKKLNIGCDVDIKGRFSFTFDFYKEKSSGLLTDITLPASLGFSSYKENLGDIENKGVELSLRGVLLKTKDAYLSISGTAIRNRNQLLKLAPGLAAWNSTVDAESTKVPRVRFEEGKSLKTIWGVKSLGINPANGNEVFIDKEGNRTETWNTADQVAIGVDESKWEGNLGLNARWKGFQLNLYWKWQYGGQLYNQTLVDKVENADKRYNCDIRVLEQTWQKPGDVTYFKGVTQNTSTQPTSRFINDYSFIQLSSGSLSYDLERNYAKYIGMQSMRVMLSINDVLRFSTVKMERGTSYPFARSVRMSLRFIF